MRIASLVPSATELLFALGVGDSVAAVTHECDYPQSAAGLPHLTRSVIAEGLSATEIDRAVRERTAEGRALYELDEPLLAELAVDLIVTQAVCEVCAVSFDDVVAAAGRLSTRPAVLSLDPSTLEDVLADIPRLAAATDAVGAGDRLLTDSRRRLADVRERVADAPLRTVVAIEWLDPLFVGGHWVPEMVAIAGGVDPLGYPGEKSRTLPWDALDGLDPELIVSMPCGYATDAATTETAPYLDRLARIGARTVAVDAAAYFSRPGPRLVDGVELLAHLIHPELCPAPPPGRWCELR